jgi:hypothetical protein
MWAFLLQLLGLGPGLVSLGNKLVDARVQLAQAANDKERVAAEERVQSLTLQMEALKTDQTAPFVRAAFAFPFLVYVNKLILWDKIISGGAGNTDPLGTDLWAMLMMIAGFYFVHWTIGRFR